MAQGEQGVGGMQTGPLPGAPSIIDDLGQELTGIAAPVALCMAIVVLLVRVLNPDGDSSANTVFIASVAYKENEDGVRGGREGAAWQARGSAVHIGACWGGPVPAPAAVAAPADGSAPPDAPLAGRLRGQEVRGRTAERGHLRRRHCRADGGALPALQVRGEGGGGGLWGGALGGGGASCAAHGPNLCAQAARQPPLLQELMLEDTLLHGGVGGAGIRGRGGNHMVGLRVRARHRAMLPPAHPSTRPPALRSHTPSPQTPTRDPNCPTARPQCYRVIFAYMGFAVFDIFFLITGVLVIQLCQVGVWVRQGRPSLRLRRPPPLWVLAPPPHPTPPPSPHPPGQKSAEITPPQAEVRLRPPPARPPFCPLT